MIRFRIHYTLNGRPGYTDVDGKDAEVIRNWFRRSYPDAKIDKMKVLRNG